VEWASPEMITISADAGTAHIAAATMNRSSQAAGVVRVVAGIGYLL